MFILQLLICLCATLLLKPFGFNPAGIERNKEGGLLTRKTVFKKGWLKRSVQVELWLTLWKEKDSSLKLPFK